MKQESVREFLERRFSEEYAKHQEEFTEIFDPNRTYEPSWRGWLNRWWLSSWCKSLW